MDTHRFEENIDYIIFISLQPNYRCFREFSDSQIDFDQVLI